MTVYDLIQELVCYPADAEVQFYVGNFVGYDCSFEAKKYYYNNKNNIELNIIIK